MKIRFKKLEIHNFFSYQDEVFEFDKTDGMNLITGKNLDIPGSKNGAGKSSLALALTYGIFGELPFELKNENIRNRFLNDNETRVCVYLDSEKKHYKIVSGLKKRASNCSLYEIVKGEERDITKSSIAETRLYIQKEIINADLNLFMRTIFLNSNPDYNFYNLSKKEKKEFIDKLFDISIYGDMFGVIHRDNLSMEKDIAVHDNTLMTLNRNSEDYMNRSEEFKKTMEENLRTLEDNLAIETKKLEEKKSRTVIRDTEKINDLINESDKLSERMSTIRLDIQKNEIAIGTSKNTISVYESKIADREKIIAKCERIHSKLCKDCKEIFSEHYKLGTYQSDIGTFSGKIKDEEEKIEKYKFNMESLKEEKDKVERTRTDTSTKIQELNSEYDTVTREIRESERIVNSLASKIETLKNSTNPYLNLIETNNKNIEKENEIFSEIKEKYSYTKFLEGIVSQENLKKYIIKDLVGILNTKIKHYLHRLGANYDIVFDENMNYEFNTQDIIGSQFHNFSSGEQARISIATCFAFRDFLSMRSSIVSNILILDEFIDANVDSQCIENVIDILKDFSKTNRQNIYLVSHRQEVGTENFDRIIQIEKKNNISSIKYLKS